MNYYHYGTSGDRRDHVTRRHRQTSNCRHARK